MPARSTALMCTNTSREPSLGVMNPKPFCVLKNLTVPVAMMAFPCVRRCLSCVCARTFMLYAIETSEFLGWLDKRPSQGSAARQNRKNLVFNNFTIHQTSRHVQLPCPACFSRSWSELLRRDGIDQRVEQVGSRSGLALPRVDIDGDDPFFRVATKGNAEMVLLILDPEIRISSPPSRLDLGVRETEPGHDVRDTLLALLGRCHG